jgi:hypothetical protein
VSDTSALYAVLGAAVGAVGSQLSGIITSVSKSRARKAKTAAAAAARTEATQRPLYTKLIRDLDRAAAMFYLLRTEAQRSPLDDGQLAGFGQCIAPVMADIYAASTDVLFDGSEFARCIVDDLLPWLARYAQSLPRADQASPENITSMIDVLQAAERRLVMAGRRDFGADRRAALDSQGEPWPGLMPDPVRRQLPGSYTGSSPPARCC